MIRRILRSLVAVIAALGTMMLLVAVGTLLAAAGLASEGPGPGAAYLAANLAISFGAAAAAGALAVRLAPERPLLHAAGVAGVMVLLSLSGGLEPAGGQPAWYPAVVLGLGLAGVAAGALWICRRDGRRRPSAPGGGPGPRRGRAV